MGRGTRAALDYAELPSCGAEEQVAIEGIDKSALALPEPRGFGIAIMSDMWRNSLVWFAAASPQMPITCASRKAGRSAAKSVMSSPCPCVEDTIAKCIAVATKPRGGRKPGSISAVAARALWLETHPLSGRHPGPFAVERRSHQSDVTIPR